MVCRTCSRPNTLCTRAMIWTQNYPLPLCFSSCNHMPLTMLCLASRDWSSDFAFLHSANYRKERCSGDGGVQEGAGGGLLKMGTLKMKWFTFCQALSQSPRDYNCPENLSREKKRWYRFCRMSIQAGLPICWHPGVIIALGTWDHSEWYAHLGLNPSHKSNISPLI